MKKKKYLNFYHKCLHDGEMPMPGLCCSLDWADDLDLFRPNGASMFRYWAEHPYLITNDHKKFNTLRQNIVLFLAAMNGEL